MSYGYIAVYFQVSFLIVLCITVFAIVDTFKDLSPKSAFIHAALQSQEKKKNPFTGFQFYGACIAVFFFWPIIFFAMLIHIIIQMRQEKMQDESLLFKIKASDLTEKLTIHEIESLESVRDPLNAAPIVPFGHLNTAWKNFLLSIDSQSDLWAFKCTYKAYAREYPIEGYVERHRDGLNNFFITKNARFVRSDD